MVINKGGWVRIVEASLAIVIVFAAVLLVYERRPTDTVSDIPKAIPKILEEIADNSSLREDIIRYDTGDLAAADNVMIMDEVNSAVRSRLANNLIYGVKICNLEDVCPLGINTPDSANVYVSERVISATSSDYSPRKIKLFVWAR